METGKRKLPKEFNPEKYKMVCCPYCRGTGKSSNSEEGVTICSRCGGFGWVKKDKS